MTDPIPFPNQPERLPDPKPAVQAPREKIILDERGMLDVPFLLLTVLLVVIGVIMMFSASYASAYVKEEGDSTYYFGRQALFALAGIALMLFFSRWNYEFWRVAAFPILAVTMLLMLGVPLYGLMAGGARRWIWLGFTFQPSEIAKVAIIISFASLISSYKDRMQTFKGLIPFLVILGMMVVTLVLQSHLSGIIIICGVAAAMLFMGGIQMRYVIGGAAALALLAVIYLMARGYAADRITAWRDPWADPQGSGFQIIQSLYAIGSGGLMGLGLGHSRQKYLYLPEEHNDYIFPIVCEELGFVGAMVIILLFMLLILRGYWIALHARNRFGALLAGGITTLIALQVFLNIGVVTNFLPSTGISLPFFSYGGTAMVMQLFGMGLVLSVSRQSDNRLLTDHKSKKKRRS